MFARRFTVTVATPASSTAIEVPTYPLIQTLQCWRWRRAYGLARRGADAGEIWCQEDEVEDLVARLVLDLGGKVVPEEEGSLAMRRYDD